MSAGYPSEASASKEELQVQVLGLHGDGFNLQVLTGSELRKMIRDRLPCKDGARVSVLRGTEKLSLRKTLTEQGLAPGQSLSLSYTYEAVDLQDPSEDGRVFHQYIEVWLRSDGDGTLNEPKCWCSFPSAKAAVAVQSVFNGVCHKKRWELVTFLLLFHPVCSFIGRR
ncbi:unnamed protein product [Durusdinium trenchii]|uniref:Ubiquitin-like domain-containing protein n=1 Tax=Durusdinium trenchii TaxID=1381693 RepID=A0ABP0NLU7_9DINO